MNFASFEKHVIDLTTTNTVERQQDSQISEENNEDASSLVAFVGSEHSGRENILEMISAINVFRHEYMVTTNSEGLKHLDRCDKPGSPPMVCHSCNQNYLCSNSIFSSKSVNELLCSCHQHFYKIHKKKGEEGVFIAETAFFQDQTLFYGLYSPPEEDNWFWHYKDHESGQLKYSTSFLLLKQRNSANLFILDHPGEEDMDGKSKLIKDFQISKKWPVNEDPDSNLKFILEVMQGRLSSSYNFIPMSDPKLSDIWKQLPSNVFCDEISIRMKHLPEMKGKVGRRAKCLDEIALLVNMIKSEQIDTRCLLIKNPFGEQRYNEETKKILNNISLACQESSIQIIMITSCPEVLASPSINTIVRFWNLCGQRRRAEKVSKSFRQKCEPDKYEEWYELLFYDVVMLVEGKSDQILHKVLNNWKDGPEERRPWLDIVPQEDHNFFIQLLDTTECFPVGGKHNLPKLINFLLQEAELGLSHFIVCDGDAIFGQSAKDMINFSKKKGRLEGESMKVLRTSSSILKINGGVLQICFQRFFSKHPKAKRVLHNMTDMYRQLYDKFVKTKLDHTRFPIPEYTNDVVTKQCEFINGTYGFCNKYLNTFGWNIPGTSCDIESAVKDMKNTDTSIAKESLLKFLRENILKMYKETLAVQETSIYHQESNQ